MLGIGLNVALRTEDFPPELREIATGLGLEPDAIEPTLARLLDLLERWLTAEPSEVLEAVRRRDALLHRTVRWARGEGQRRRDRRRGPADRGDRRGPRRARRRRGAPGAVRRTRMSGGGARTIARRAPVLLAWIAALALPAGAAASSLVFVKRDGNAWLAAADGTAQLRVTTDGTPANPYYSASQSVTGVIEVARGSGRGARIYTFDRTGRRLSVPFTVALAPVVLDPVISPDGSKVALWTSSPSAVATPCYVNSFCFEVSNARRYNQLVRPAWMTFEHPAWLGSSRLLLFTDSGTLAYADLSGHGFTPWLRWGDYHAAADGLGEWVQGAASSDGRELALVTHLDVLGRFEVDLFGGRANMGAVDLATYKPTPLRCRLTAPDGGSGADPMHPSLPAFRNLSFSPHGTALAYEWGGSIWVATLARCRARRVIAGARDPSWGPRSVSRPRKPPAVGRGKAR